MTTRAAQSEAGGDGRSFGVMLVVLTLIGWSVTPLFIRHFADYIDAWTSNGWRYGFSALLWAPLLIAGLYRRSLPEGLWRMALVPGLLNAFGQVCFTTAHYRIDPGLLTFGLRTQIIFVAVGAAVLFPVERLVIRTRGFVTGLALVFGGTMGTVLLGEGMVEPAKASGVGLALLAGAGFAGYAIAVRYYMHGVHSMVAFAAISQYTALAMVVLMLAFGERGGAGVADMPAGQVGLLLLSSVIGIAAGHVLYYMSIARLGVAVSTGVIQLQPFCVSVMSYFLFREILTVWQWGSGMVAVGGAVLILYVQQRIKRRAAASRYLFPVEPPTAEFEDLPPDHVAAAAVAESVDFHPDEIEDAVDDRGPAP